MSGNATEALMKQVEFTGVMNQVHRPARPQNTTKRINTTPNAHTDHNKLQMLFEFAHKVF